MTVSPTAGVREQGQAGGQERLFSGRCWARTVSHRAEADGGVEGVARAVVRLEVVDPPIGVCSAGRRGTGVSSCLAGGARALESRPHETVHGTV